MMGIYINLSQSKANLWIHFLTPLLEEVLSEAKLMLLVRDATWMSGYIGSTDTPKGEKGSGKRVLT
jgi:hypothetical protein